MGVVIVLWNFFVGIFVGIIVVFLVVGNWVIYKSLSLFSVIGYKFCECFWDVGVFRDAFIYLSFKGSDISEYFLKDESI